MDFSSPSWPNDKQNISPLNITMLQTVFEAVFNNMDDGVFLCNNEGRVVLMNTAALRLFPVASNAPSKEVTDRDIFQQYEWYNEENQRLSLDQFPLTNLQTQKSSHSQECYTVILSGPHEKKIFQLYCSLILGPQKHVSGIFCVLRPLTAQQQTEKQQVLVYQSVTTLIRAALDIPNLLTIPIDKEPLLLPPNLGSFGQHLADVTRHVLQSEKVFLLAVGAEQRLYYVATSGLTSEQRRHRFEINGRISLDDFFESSIITHLIQNDCVILKYDQISLPPPLTYAFHPDALLLGTPILLEQQLVGILFVSKNVTAYQYSEEEIFLTQSIAQLLTLLLISMRALSFVDKEQASTLLHHETETLIDSFLTSASHELRTPLTIVTGNIQLARRRLKTLLYQLLTPSVGQSEEIKKKMEKIQQLLDAANQGASTLDALLDTIITDVQIHQSTFLLKKKRFDLSKLLHDVVQQQHNLNPAIPIHLHISPSPLFLLADPQRIEQVITIYLIDAIKHTPADQPVFVQAKQVDDTISVAVSDEGPAIPRERLKHVWERFSSPRVQAPVHDSDWDLGLGLSLCKELIQKHHGSVGVQNGQDHGVTFWFTVPATADDDDLPHV